MILWLLLKISKVFIQCLHLYLLAIKISMMTLILDFKHLQKQHLRLHIIAQHLLMHLYYPNGKEAIFHHLKLILGKNCPPIAKIDWKGNCSDFVIYITSLLVHREFLHIYYHHPQFSLIQDILSLKDFSLYQYSIIQVCKPDYLKHLS